VAVFPRACRDARPRRHRRRAERRHRRRCGGRGQPKSARALLGPERRQLYQREAGGDSRAEYLGRAETIARKALAHFGRDGYERQPAAFNAIYFRNLLLLHAATGDAALRAEILETLRRYTDHAWYETRDRRDLFHFSDGGVTLLNQSAMVQLLALLAWDPGAYGRLA
jgi:hypothetical protein